MINISIALFSFLIATFTFIQTQTHKTQHSQEGNVKIFILSNMNDKQDHCVM